MKKNSIAKSFIKKAVNPSHRSGFYSHVFFRLTSICLCLAVAVSVMAIPAYAETELVKITLTAQDLYNIFLDSYDSSYQRASVFILDSGNATVYPFDNINNPSNLIGPIEFTLYNSDNPIFAFISDDIFYVYFPYLIYPNENSSYFFISQYDFPFSYYFDTSSLNDITISVFTESGSSNFDGILSLIDYTDPDNPDGIFRQEISAGVLSSEFLSWNQSPLTYFTDNYTALNSILPAFNNPAKVDLKYSFLGTEEKYSALSFIFSFVELSSPQLVAFPLCFGIHSFDVYVEQEIAPDVEQYLDAIAGPPTAENQTKINNLKQKFDSIDSDLEQSAQDMEVEVPDISNKLDTLPPEVTQGNSMVSTNIYTPMLNIPFVTTIFTALFSFLALKLILHGGGKK